MYCLASLYPKKRKMHSFGMNTSVYKHVRQIVWNFGYRFLISKILICPLPERIQKVRIANSLFSCCEKRYFVSETIWLPMILDCWSFVRCVFFSRPFSTNTITNKNRLILNLKGTPYSGHCLFKLRKRADQQQESYSSYRTLKTDKNWPRNFVFT